MWLYRKALKAAGDEEGRLKSFGEVGGALKAWRTDLLASPMLGASPGLRGVLRRVGGGAGAEAVTGRQRRLSRRREVGGFGAPTLGREEDAYEALLKAHP